MWFEIVWIVVNGMVYLWYICVMVVFFILMVRVFGNVVCSIVFFVEV